MNTEVISSLKLLQIELLWSFVHKSLFGHKFSFFLGKSLNVEWVVYMLGVC